MTGKQAGGGSAALITGATGGIGGAIVGRLAAGGWRVAAGGRAPISTSDPSVFPLRFDVTSASGCESAVANVIEHFGRLDLLVNCAGVLRKGFPTDLSEADWDHVLDVNLKGPFLLSKAAIPHLIDSGGSIINVASDAGLVGIAGHSAYCASKGGLVLMTKAMALDLAPHGVRVNAICPGNTDTAMLRSEAEESGDSARFLEEQRLMQPQGEAARFVEPGEVAAMVSYLAGDEAAAVTGAAISIDFGTSAGIS